MKCFFSITKGIGIFILVEIFICFILSFLNMFGLNSSLSKLILFIINITIFFIIAFKEGRKTKRKGYIEGIYTGSRLILCLFVITLLFFIKNISIYTVLYYLSLLLSSIIGSISGKNSKKD